MRILRPIAFALAAAFATVNADALHKLEQRSFVDVCGHVEENLSVLGIIFGAIDLCLCVSNIPVLLQSNLIVQLAALVAGESAVIASLTALINGAPDHKQCYFPDHAIPRCDINPCDFDCNDGFTPSPPTYPTSCVCTPPHTVCNGICGYFPSCSSQKVKRDTAWRDATCPHGWSACGIWGGERLSYECVDVQKDLWSCGGCDLPLLPTDPIGTDCTAITGVHDVGCISGRCAVQRCKDGFEVSSDRTTCLATTRMSPHNPVALFNNGEGSFKA